MVTIDKRSTLNRVDPPCLGQLGQPHYRSGAIVGIVGWILIVLGILTLFLGLIAGAKDLFERKNEAGAQSLLPTEFFKVLLKLLEAPAYKFFFVMGLILVLVGLGLTGAEVFSSTENTVAIGR